MINDLRIDEEFHALIPPLSQDEYNDLETSILAEGCRDALVAWDGILIDGHNRFDICERHGFPFNVVELDFENRDEVIVWICSNQMARRNITQVAKDMLALRMKPALTRLAKQRMSQGVAESATPSKVRDEIAETAGTSGRGIAQTETILESAPEALKEAALSGEVSRNRAYELTRRLLQLPEEQREAALRLSGDSTDKADTLIRLYESSGSPQTNGTYDELLATGGFHHGDDMEDWCNFSERTSREIDAALKSVAQYHAKIEGAARRQERLDRIQALPEDIYSVLYADPPWEYQNSGIQTAAAKQYDTMPTEEICTLLDRLPELKFAADAVLLLWVTNPLLKDGMRVLDAWGFRYVTNRVWIKTRGIGGFHVNGRHELLLVGTRGQFRPDALLDSVITGDNDEHSKKPELYDDIEQAYPRQRYAELFGRNRPEREGWSFWGDQVHAE
jgi:N6-adenosine-specific RNA methylase IME4